jgi:hypothetical protein
MWVWRSGQPGWRFSIPTERICFRVWQVIAAALALAIATGIVVSERRRRPYLMVGWLWFLGSMLPMIGLVQVGRHAMADRFAYIPYIGLFVMAVWTVADWARGPEAFCGMAGSCGGSDSVSVERSDPSPDRLLAGQL